MVRDAAHEAAKSGEPILPAPHHEAGRDRGCIKLIGICFSGPIPKFVNVRGILRYELRNLRTTSNSMNLVRLLNLRFLNELAATNDRNLKFAALVPPI